MDKSAPLMGIVKDMFVDDTTNLSIKELLHRALVITKKRKRKKRINLFSIFHLPWSFDKGRYFQFLLDMNYKKYGTTLLLSGEVDIKQKALKCLTKILAPKEGEVLEHTFCECGEWIVGNKRCKGCEWGARLYYIQEICESLDDYEPRGYVDTW